MTKKTKLRAAEDRLARQWPGLSRHRSLSSFSKKAIEKGADRESEHVGGHRGLARRIAADHLVEDRHYYDGKAAGNVPNLPESQWQILERLYDSPIPISVRVSPQRARALVKLGLVDVSRGEMRILDLEPSRIDGRPRQGGGISVWLNDGGRSAIWLRRGYGRSSGRTAKLDVRYEDDYGEGYYRQPRGALVLYLEGVYVGSAGFLRYPNSPDQVSLEHVVIEPQYQKKGLGKILVSEVKRYVNKTTPYVKYVSADFASRASLHVMITVLGSPLMLGNEIRCVSIEEAERLLPATSRTRTLDNGRTSVDSGAPVSGIFWIGKGRRPSKSPFNC